MNEAYIDRIHRYLGGSMDASERETFEAELRQNRELQNDLTLERLLLDGIDRAGESELRQTIGAVHGKLKAEGFFERPADSGLRVTFFNQLSNMKRTIAIAATFLLLAAAVWFFTRPSGADRLYANYYQPREDVQRAKEIIPTLESVGMAGVHTEKDTLRDALQLYADGDYPEAEKQMKDYLESNPEDLMAVYFLGATYMCEGNFDKAIDVFLPLSRSESPLKNDALWNLGLCYLKAENTEAAACATFAQLSGDSSYPKHGEAKAIMDQWCSK